MSEATLHHDLHGDPPTAAVMWFSAPMLVYYEEVQAMGQQLFAFQEANPELNFVLCFRGVQGVSSAMLGKLITLFRRVARGQRRMVLCELEPDVAEMFTSSRLSDYFPIRPTRADALAWLSTPAE